VTCARRGYSNLRATSIGDPGNHSEFLKVGKNALDPCGRTSYLPPAVG